MPDVNLAYQTVFKLVGKQGQRVLEKKEFLDSVAKVDKDLAKTIEKSVEGVTNPTFELSGKATANYNIAGLKIRNGNNEVIGTGAVSKAQDDFYDNTVIIKGRFDLPNGEKIRIDGGHDEYSEAFNVYRGKDRTLQRECSYRDAGYTDLQPIRTFDRAGNIGEYKVFDAKKNKMTTVYKYGDDVIGDMKITKGKNGVVKLEMKNSKDSCRPLVEYYDAEGNRLAESSIWNSDPYKYKTEIIYNKNGNRLYQKTTYFKDEKPNRFENECFYEVPNDAPRILTSLIDEKTGKEVITGYTTGDGYSPFLSERDLAKMNDFDNNCKTLENFSTTFDKFITYLMK